LRENAMSNVIEISDLSSRGNRLTIKVKAWGKVKRYIATTKLYVEYDVPVEEADISVLSIPAIANFALIAWATGTDIYVKRIDQVFLDGLKDVKKTFMEFYPSIDWKGDIYACEISKTVTKGSDVRKAMLLFSGGIDSLCSFIRHQREQPSLVMVHGIDIPLRNKLAWKRKVAYLKDFSHIHELQFHCVRSNLKQVLDYLRIDHAFEEKVKGSWWVRVQHAFSILSLCAPLSVVTNKRILYMAADCWERCRFPVATGPKIERAIRWANVQVEIDGYEMSRQERVQFIAKWIQRHAPDLRLHVCWESASSENCSICEKCCRTILGLELAGLDPNGYGFAVEDETFVHVRTNLESGKWLSSPSMLAYWQDLQDHCSGAKGVPHKGAKDFVQWLQKVDLSLFASKNSISKYHKLLKSIARYFPRSMRRFIRAFLKLKF